MHCLKWIYLFCSLSYSGIALADFEPEAGIDSGQNYCQQYYDQGYKKGYSEGQNNYDCKKEKHRSYNKGYGEGLKYNGGYDGGYKKGHGDGYKKGYDRGYQTAQDEYPSGSGLCAFVFKFDGFILLSDDSCESSDVCEDNDTNTIDVCLLVPQLE